MAIVIIMPKQGQSVESCIIGLINKKKGGFLPLHAQKANRHQEGSKANLKIGVSPAFESGAFARDRCMPISHTSVKSWV